MTEPVAASPNRVPIILGAGLAAVLAVFAATQLLGGDDGGDEATTPTTTPFAQVPEPTVTSTTVVASPPAETFEVFSTKNPFLALRTLGGTAGTGATGTRPATGTAGTAGTVTTGGTTGTAGTAGTTGTVTGGTSGTGTGGTAAREPIRGTRVALLDVFADGGRTVANVRIGDTVHKVAEGEVFATSFKVVSLDQGDKCGRFLFGDDAFRLCKGEESLK